MPVPRNDAAIGVLSTVLTQGHHDRPADLVVVDVDHALTRYSG